MFVLLDFHPYLTDPLVVRILKEIVLDYHVNEHTIVLISHAIELPGELRRLGARFELALPNDVALENLVIEEAKLWAMNNGGKKLRADPTAMRLLVKNLSGLTVTDARRLIRNAIHHDGAITTEDIPEITKAKYELLAQEGALSFEYETAKFSDVGGLVKLKTWLEKRTGYFLGAETALLDRPKGILLLGIQGSGKSLAAKAVAGVWGVPLLRMDFGALYNKFFGETEKNIRDALKTAQLMAPCVLWIDEIEKGLATGDHDNGTSKRVLATLLTWMAENKAAVFIVATANDISSLPPELIRKGRLDEIFFVDLPKPDVRTAIFAIHLRKRGYDPSQFDTPRLAEISAGYSGAEIEQAVVAACYSAHAAQTPLNSTHIEAEITNTRPLSLIMEEEISTLRAWAAERTVQAD